MQIQCNADKGEAILGVLLQNYGKMQKMPHIPHYIKPAGFCYFCR